MAYEPYATAEEFAALLPEEDYPGDDAMLEASRHVDSLTWNRIVHLGRDSLTEFQQEIITEVVCRLALWETENADGPDGLRALTRYDINGVEMGFSAGADIRVYTGREIPIPKTLWSLLQQTGLCVRSLAGWRG